MEVGAPINVLHVDDEPGFGELVETFLEREGDRLTVTSVESPDTALEHMTETRVDCVVSDYDMPDISGLEFLNAVRARRPGVPFILFTGKGSEDVARDAFRVGVTDYMQKDSGTDQYTVLANRIRNAVSQYRAETTSARYDTVFESMDNAVFVLDSRDTLVSVNDVYAEAVDASRPELLGRPLASLPAFDSTLVAEHVSRLRATHDTDSVEFEAAFSPADGDVRQGTVHLTSLPREDGEYRGAIGTWAERNAADCEDEQLHYTTGLKDLVLDTSTSLMSAEPDEIDTKIHWTLQSVGEYIGVDRCVVYSTGDRTDSLDPRYSWSREGVPDTGHVPAPTTEEFSWVYDRLDRFEDVTVADVEDLPPEADAVADWLGRHEATTGTAVPMVSDWELSGALVVTATEREPLSDEEVRLVRTVGDMVSHTLDRRRRERTLRRQNERLEEFASVISHDLRNPLNVASGFIEMATKTGDEDALARAAEAIERMDELIDDVLTLARQGRTVGDPATVVLDDLVRDAWDSVDTAAATLSVEEALGEVTADESRLGEAVENLFRNAVTHGGDDVTVTVGPLPDGNGFYVADDGEGIPPDERELVFEQGHTTEEDGTGFGLAIVERIVEAHGWDIAVGESRDGGARFDVRTAQPSSTVSAPALVGDD